MLSSTDRQSWSLPEREVTPILPQQPNFDSPVFLTLKLRGAVEQSVTVSSLESVSCLSPESGTKFIHNGRVLCPALSFRFLQIQDGDEIFVVGQSRKPNTQPLQSSVHGLTNSAISRMRERFDADFSFRFKDPR
jgi:hypothetical protein